MSTSDKNYVDAQEIPLEQLSEIAGGASGGNQLDGPAGQAKGRGAPKKKAADPTPTTGNRPKGGGGGGGGSNSTGGSAIAVGQSGHSRSDV